VPQRPRSGRLSGEQNSAVFTRCYFPRRQTLWGSKYSQTNRSVPGRILCGERNYHKCEVARCCRKILNAIFEFKTTLMNRIATPVLALIVLSCSVLKREDPNEKVREFLFSFESSLYKTENMTLEFFATKQSRDAILAIVRVLQNKDQLVVCTPDFKNALIYSEQLPIQAKIPIIFSIKGANTSDTVHHQLRINIEPIGDSFKIIDIEGEAFYHAFQRMKNISAWDAALQEAIDKRAWIFENARVLRERFDSVVWYTELDNARFFYVTRGRWNHPFSTSKKEYDSAARMGLVDQEGEIVIPVEYDLIGTIGFQFHDKVEVMRDGRVGYFDLESRKLVIEPIYDWIAPSDQQDAFAVCKKDSLVGWLDKSYEFNAGFKDDEMRQWISRYSFLQRAMYLTGDQYGICEVPDRNHVGDGTIIPPAYLSKFGVLEPILNGMTTTERPFNGWTAYVEKKTSTLATLSSQLTALVTVVKERYLEGREEFYTSSKVLLMSDFPPSFGSADISGEIASIRMVDSTLIEIQTPHDYWFAEEDVSEELNLIKHSYVSITNQGVKQLASRRLFPQTEFVMLDSSYVTGEFIVYNKEKKTEEKASFLSRKTLSHMRNEILASNGYTFPELGTGEHFQYLREGKDEIDSFDKALERLSPIDRHNFEFLSSLLADKPV
jgi:hypothetical protein